MSCRNAFLSASKTFVEKDLDVSMAGRAFMITGANSGIGKATAMAIAKRGTNPSARFSAFQLIYEDKLNACFVIDSNALQKLFLILVFLGGVIIIAVAVVVQIVRSHCLRFPSLDHTNHKLSVQVHDDDKPFLI